MWTPLAERYLTDLPVILHGDVAKVYFFQCQGGNALRRGTPTKRSPPSGIVRQRTLSSMARPILSGPVLRQFTASGRKSGKKWDACQSVSSICSISR
eukprot:651229-Amphidinium_carterae.1